MGEFSIRKGVIILIQKQDKKYLIVKQQNGSWSLPSGGTEEAESPLQAAIRELYEESGIANIQLYSTDIVNTFFYSKQTQGEQQGFVGIYEEEEIPGIIAKEEILNTMWVSIMEAKDYLLRPNQYNVFLSLVDKLNQI